MTSPCYDWLEKYLSNQTGRFLTLKKTIVIFKTVTATFLTIAVFCGLFAGCGTAEDRDSATSDENPVYEQVADEIISPTQSNGSAGATVGSTSGGAADAIVDSTPDITTPKAPEPARASPKPQSTEPDTLVTATVPLPEIDKNITATLTITGAVGTLDQFDSIIHLFNEKFPNVTVVKDAIAWDTSNRSAGDAQRTQMNAKVLGGQAGDIILPMNGGSVSFFRQRALADLREFMYGDPEFDTGDYFMSVVEAYSFNGELYVMPLSNIIKMAGFYKPLAGERSFAHKGDTWELTQALDIAKNIADQDGLKGKHYIIGFHPDWEFFRTMLSLNYAKFIDLEAGIINIDSAEFIDMLKYVKGLADAGYIYSSERDDGNVADGAMIMDYGTIWSMMNHYIADQSVIWDIRPLTGNNGELNIARDNYEDATLAISEYSENRRLAWEFVKFAISYEVQSSPIINYNSPPINRAAVLTFAEQRYKAAKAIQLEFNEEAAKPDYFKPDEAEVIKQYAELIASLNDKVTKYAYNDYDINQAIHEQADEFFRGDISAEETARALQRKVSMIMEG